MKKIPLFLLMLLLAVACSSPESAGRKAAEKLVKCDENAVKELVNQYEDFIRDFDSYKFSSRVACSEKVQALEDKVEAQYEKDQTDAKKAYQKACNKYISNQQKYGEFAYAYTAVANNNTAWEDASGQIGALRTQINNLRLSIIPSQPHIAKIKSDLVGKTILKPERTRYRNAFEIREEKNILSLNIESFQEVEKDNELVYSVHLDLDDDINIYKADVKITYILEDNDDWTISYIESQYLDIVSTGKFDNCISHSLQKSFEGYIYFENNCDVALLVEGLALEASLGWKEFSQLVDANGTASFHGGLFSDIKDYKIQRIERP